MKLSPQVKYLLGAVLVGLVAVFLVHQYITVKLGAAAKPTGPVVVAETDIAPGTVLEARLLRQATWPTDIIPSKSVSTIQQVNGRTVLVPVAKGEPILLTKLAPEGTRGGLSGLLDPNMLAVTVKTDEVSGVAGFINPGDRVDVLVEMPRGGGETGEDHFSKIILQNLKVLSKGQVWDQTAEKKPQVVNTVTLEVTPEQAEMLNLATFRGKIRLALRSQLNQNYFATKGVDTSQLLNKPPVPKSPAVVKPEAKPPEKPTVMLIRGMTINNANY